MGSSLSTTRPSDRAIFQSHLFACEACLSESNSPTKIATLETFCILIRLSRTTTLPYFPSTGRKTGKIPIRCCHCESTCNMDVHCMAYCRTQNRDEE